jgi:[ribosomal protein S5]-alanine N-acetyltransferase
MTPMLQSPRLLLRPPRLADAADFYAFLGDPEALRFTHCDASLRACRRRLAGFEWQRRRNGIAPWAVVANAEQRLVGWGGLYEDPFETGWGVELGYAFRPEAWGKGYATELASACLDWADTVLRLPEVCAFVHPDNAASRRVLEKVGFEPVRFVPEMRRILLRRTRLDAA